mgnify:CR=1 FL=1
MEKIEQEQEDNYSSIDLKKKMKGSNKKWDHKRNCRK